MAAATIAASVQDSSIPSAREAQSAARHRSSALQARYAATACAWHRRVRSPHPLEQHGHVPHGRLVHRAGVVEQSLEAFVHAPTGGGEPGPAREGEEIILVNPWVDRGEDHGVAHVQVVLDEWREAKQSVHIGVAPQGLPEAV